MSERELKIRQHVDLFALDSEPDEWEDITPEMDEDEYSYLCPVCYGRMAPADNWNGPCSSECYQAWKGDY